MFIRRAKAQNSPFVIEVAGLAGAGKTTVAQAMCRSDRRCRLGVSLPRIAYAPFFINNAVSLLPSFLRNHEGNQWWSTEDRRSMTYLKGWLFALALERWGRRGVVILDHGPAFRLAQLDAFGPSFAGSRAFDRWWKTAADQWSSALDLIVWLDAPNAILQQRIESRERWHLVKGKSDREVREFLTRYRVSFDRVIAALTTNGGPRIMAFQTDREPVDGIADSVLRACRSPRPLATY